MHNSCLTECIRGLIFILFLIFLSCKTSVGQETQRYNEVIDSLTQLQLELEAIAYFKKEVKEFPNNQKAREFLIQSYVLDENYFQAVVEIEKTLELFPDCGNCYRKWALVHTYTDDIDTALVYINKAIEINPEEVLNYSFRAQVLSFLGQNLKAKSDYNKTISLEPEEWEHYYSRGVYSTNQGYTYSAKDDFEKVMELNPEEYLPYFQRAHLYYNLKKYDLALLDLDKAISMDSTDVMVFVGRGAIYDILKNHQQAISDYSKAIELDETYVISFVNRASSYYQIENLDGACGDYERALEIIEENHMDDPALIAEIENYIETFCNPDTPNYYYQRGIGYYNLGEYQNGIDIYKEGIEKFPESSMTWSFLGNANMKLNRFQEAHHAYLQSLQLSSGLKEEIRKNRNYIGESEQSIENYAEGIISSNYAGLAESCFRLGRSQEALDHIHMAIERTLVDFFGPLDNYYNLRGNIYMNLQEYDLAILDFKSSIIVQPMWDVSYQNIGLAILAKHNIAAYDSYSTEEGSDFDFLFNDSPETLSTQAKKDLNDALGHFDSALSLNPNFDMVYLLRGLTKKVLHKSDYCLDYAAALQLGFPVPEEFLQGCNLGTK